MKRISILLLVLIITFTSAGCMANGRKNLDFWGMKTSYGEWADNIGLLNRDGLTISVYKEHEDGLIEVGVQVDDVNSEDGFMEFCNLIDTHNKFVEENPNYFPDDAKIVIGMDAVTRYDVCFFSERNKLFSCMDVDTDGLGYSDDMTIKYVSIDIFSCDWELGMKNVKYNVPVVILCDNGVGPTREGYEILNRFDQLEKVILEYSYDYAGFEDIKQFIHGYNSDVEVYKMNEDRQIEIIGG
jgi:hypothetical protein